MGSSGSSMAEYDYKSVRVAFKIKTVVRNYIPSKVWNRIISEASIGTIPLLFKVGTGRSFVVWVTREVAELF